MVKLFVDQSIHESSKLNLICSYSSSDISEHILLFSLFSE